MDDKLPKSMQRDEEFDQTIRINEASLRKKMIAVLLKRVATADIDEVVDAQPAQASHSADLEKAGFMVLPRRFPWLLQLEGLITNRPLGVAVVGDVVFGMGGPGVSSAPDLDLSLYGGADKGVSRRHFMLRPTKTELLGVDLGSTNGTRINGKQIDANKETALKHGDLVSLGAMTFTVKIIANPDDFEEARRNPIDADMDELIPPSKASAPPASPPPASPPSTSPA